MRLLSVLALDRFGDFVFVGDAVVCPVRESMGQPMGVVLGGLSSSIVISVARVVRHVIDNREWHRAPNFGERGSGARSWRGPAGAGEEGFFLLQLQHWLSLKRM